MKESRTSPPPFPGGVMKWLQHPGHPDSMVGSKDRSMGPLAESKGQVADHDTWGC